MLAGCSSEQRGAESGAANINAAAVAAQGDIDTYAASTLQSAEPVATPLPKAAPAAPPAAKVAAPRTAPTAAPAVAKNSQVAAVPIGTTAISCDGQTRVSARAEDADFVRADRDAPVEQRGSSGVWQPAAGPAVQTDRAAGEQPSSIRCATN